MSDTKVSISVYQGCATLMGQLHVAFLLCEGFFIICSKFHSQAYNGHQKGEGAQDPE